MNSSSSKFVRSRAAKVAAVFFAFVAGSAATTQTPKNPIDPDAMNVLRKAAAQYSDLKSYEAKITVATLDDTKTSERHFTETGSGNAFRCEEDAPGAMLRIGDGKAEWTVDRKANTYSKAESSAAEAPYLSELAGIDQNVKKAEILREDLFTADGQTKKVYIVELVRDPWPRGTPADVQFATVRVDEKTFEIAGMNLYTDGPTLMLRYSIAHRNQNVPRSLLAFKPPPSAKEVATIGAAPNGESSVIGTQAPDFTLSDAAGRAYHLQDLRGKVVIVDFWASWCGPCRASMPYIQAMYDDYASRGLMVLGLDGGEDADTVKDFATNQKFTFPLLVGGEPIVTGQYFVDAYPTTIVIDRNGRIVYRSSGMDIFSVIGAVKTALDKSN